MHPENPGTLSKLSVVPEMGDSVERHRFYVADGVTGLRTLISNCYFIATPDGWVLVDTGLPGFANRTIQVAEELFGPGRPPLAIILTHGHFDHIGGIHTLTRRWDVPVYAHTLELPFLSGRSDYPPPDPTVGGGLMAHLSGLYPNRATDLDGRLRDVATTGALPELPGWRWLHTPGHSPGHISLFREVDRLLIAGDAVITVRQESLLNVIRQTPEVNGPPAYFTPDWRSARLSVQDIARLEPEILASGHGLPMHGTEMKRQLAILARDFDLTAVPAFGRYVPDPAVTDDTGVLYLPKKQRPSTLALTAMLLAGLALGVGLATSVRSRT